MTWLRVIRAGGQKPHRDPICQMAYDIARRSGRDHDDAEDTASDARGIVRRHARAHPGFPATPGDERKFVLKVVVNLIKDKWKLDVGRRKLEGRVAETFESEPSVFYDPEQSVDELIAEDERAEAEEERQLADVNRQIASRSPERRLILFMRKWLEMSYAEIATVLDMTPGSVGQNLSDTMDGVRAGLGVEKAKKNQREKKA